MTFDETPLSVNNAARKQRHQRIKSSAVFQNWRRIERDLSPKERKIERNFFWTTTSASTVLFFLLSLLPQLPFVNAQDFWSVDGDQSQPIALTDYNIPMVSEGFLLKKEIITITDEDRTSLTDIREYTIRPGETLSQIADIHGVTEATIMENNGITNANSIRSGQVIKIPPVNSVIHTVVENDTLDKIVKKYAKDKVEKEKILTQNNLDPEEPLTVGMNLIIPGARKDLPPPPRPTVRNIARSSGSSGYVPRPSNFSGSVPVGRLLKPTSGVYTQYFHRGHYAIDVASGMNTPIYAAESGVVIKAAYGWNGGYGNHIIIDHGNGMQTLYAHNNKMYVTTGQRVSKGETIAGMGNTGRVYGRTGIHLHFEVRVNGVKQNPLKYF